MRKIGATRYVATDPVIAIAMNATDPTIAIHRCGVMRGTIHTRACAYTRLPVVALRPRVAGTSARVFLLALRPAVFHLSRRGSSVFLLEGFLRIAMMYGSFPGPRRATP